MSLAAYYLEYGRHVARLRRRRRRAYTPTSNTVSHDNHDKINSWVSFFSYTCLSMGLGLAALRAAGAQLSFAYVNWVKRYKYRDMNYHHNYIQTLSNCKIKA